MTITSTIDTRSADPAEERPEGGLGTSPSTTPLGHAIGAEISGIRVSGDITDEEVEYIRTALATYKVVGFRGQEHVDDETQYAFAKRLGTPTLAHPTVQSRGTERLSIEGAANSWHTDVSFVDRIPKASILRAVTIPEFGGATLFANTVAAYASLPEPLRVLADNLWALHSNDYDYASSGVDPKKYEGAGNPYRAEFTRLKYETEHPVVHVRAETGERSLLLGHFVKNFVGLRSYESSELFRIFQERILKPDNTFRWEWNKGDVVIWDNHGTQHYGVSDFGNRSRKVHRVTLAGTVPVSVNGEPSRIIVGDATHYSVVDTPREIRGFRGDASEIDA
ncbi:TauD/TfdA dioxygenase family protein [Dietzia sp.]|uniref:TauD/TfdA dioxygenase family protein n=1 Tax=Dietzia sp. TaxID=1871616 RepID=UPI003FA5868F